MPTITDQAIPIRLWDYSETSQTACLFCCNTGLMRGLAKGSKREKSKFSGGLEILTRGEIVAIIRPNADLANLIEWDLQHIYPGARTSLAAHHATLYMADLIYNAVTDHDPHPDLFNSFHAHLNALTPSPDAPQDPGVIPAALLGFQWSLLSETGYRPHLENAPDDPTHPFAFDPALAALVPDPGPGSNAPVWRVRPQTVAILKALERGETSPLSDASAHLDALIRAGRLLSEYLKHLLQRDLPTRNLVYPASPNPPTAPIR